VQGVFFFLPFLVLPNTRSEGKKGGGGGDCFKKLTLEYKCEIIRTYILVHKT